jgi:hypothetical protein
MLSLAQFCMAQVELSTGIEFGYPMLINNNKLVDAGQISSGLKFGVTYKPEEVQFFPTLDCSFGNSRLPLQHMGEHITSLEFNYLNVMLNETYVIRHPRTQLFLYGGIGFSRLKERGVAPGGNETIVTTIDSTLNINKVFPAMNIGFAFDLSEPNDKMLYMTIGVNFRYTFLPPGHNTYYVTVAEQGNNINNRETSLTGNLIRPDFYIAVHCKLHKKKDN